MVHHGQYCLLKLGTVLQYLKLRSLKSVTAYSFELEKMRSETETFTCETEVLPESHGS